MSDKQRRSSAEGIPFKEHSTGSAVFTALRQQHWLRHYISAGLGNQRAYSFAMGIYLLFWCVLSIMFLVASLRTNYVTIGVFVFLALGFFFLSLSRFIETSSMVNAVRLNKVGGACTFLCGLGAFYLGASGLMVPETTFVRLPLGMIAPPAGSPAALLRQRDFAPQCRHKVAPDRMSSVGGNRRLLKLGVLHLTSTKLAR
ncbi:predicted protein [Histoplasma mississippiense (nom. inval.)]|uniref:predicted protein n=1 Tax=Ajellomyces capsulatus (strain NAm1 / WU24) TaxID=2059318 RepID=UPI000157D183|nr:predicted protein [Histoplasma mississippiense (nom. inval.)]EDN04324.1 predicted protein [Histoplasma mississippiense (nom. inval.)]